MGTYDTVHHGDRYEQVKLWGKGLRYLHVGDRVGLPRGGLGPTGTYTVAMHTGGFAHVVDGVLTGWEEEPGAGPLLTTGGGRFDPADWPGGPFGPWYRDADAPPERRVFAGLERDCPRHGAPALRVARDDDPDLRRERALAAARADVAARLAAGLDEAGRVEAARGYLADRRGWVQVASAGAAGFLGIPEEPVRAGDRLVALLSTAVPGAPEWRNAASLLEDRAAGLPASAVAESLRLLAAALPRDGEAEADWEAEFPDAVAHPAIRRRRRSVARADDRAHRLGRYDDLHFRAAAEAAVARHGAAVLPAIPLPFWGRDIVADEVAAPLLVPVLGRDLTPGERNVLTWALLGVPGFLATLDAGTLEAALRRTLAG
ncbi:hypothetical protein ACI8AA_08655 [Geodermatophilus sp. SYSU D01180]